MVPEITTEKMSIYQAAARQRRQQKEEWLELRRQRAWEVAQQASQILKEQFEAHRVVVFGSTRFVGHH